MKRFVKLAALCMVITLLSLSVFSTLLTVQASTSFMVGNGDIGEGVGKQTTLVDFANSDLDGFAPYSGTESLSLGSSAVWGTDVLKTKLSSPENEEGITKTFADASILTDASTLSIQQVAQTTAYAVTLRLLGTDKDGAPLAYVAHVNATSNEWQTITFDIATFSSLIDTTAPLSITVLGSAQNEENAGASWMIKSLYICTPETFPEIIIPLVAAICGLTIGVILLVVIYRTVCKKNRRPRWEEEF